MDWEPTKKPLSASRSIYFSTLIEKNKNNPGFLLNIQYWLYIHEHFPLWPTRGSPQQNIEGFQFTVFFRVLIHFNNAHAGYVCELLLVPDHTQLFPSIVIVLCVFWSLTLFCVFAPHIVYSRLSDSLPSIFCLLFIISDLASQFGLFTCDFLNNICICIHMYSPLHKDYFCSWCTINY